MLTFDLSEDQCAIQAMAKDFAEGEIRPLAERLDRSQQPLRDFPWALVRKGSELGFRTVALPRDYDGLELDARTWVILIDELGYRDAACAGIFSRNWNPCRAIASLGTAAQKDQWLSLFRDDDAFLIGGDAGIANPAGDETGGDEAQDGGALTATRLGDCYRLNGERRFVSLGPVAKLLLVSAETAQGRSTFLVPSNTPGLTVAPPHDEAGLRIALEGALVFDNATVAAANLLGEKEGLVCGEPLCAAAAIEVSAQAMALARAAIDATTAFAGERVQGGKRIIEHQAVSLSLAEMFVALQAGRSLLWRAAWELDNGRADRALATSCKVFCTEAAVEICHEALELFGGSGVMRELPMQKYYRDSWRSCTALAPTPLAASRSALSSARAPKRSGGRADPRRMRARRARHATHT